MLAAWPMEFHPTGHAALLSTASRRSKFRLSQNTDSAGQFFVVKSAAPFAVTVSIGHALEAGALNHEKLDSEWRCFVMRFGLVFCVVASYRMLQWFSGFFGLLVMDCHGFRYNFGHIFGQTVAAEGA
jgi:hypothetical protein